MEEDTLAAVAARRKALYRGEFSAEREWICNATAQLLAAYRQQKRKAPAYLLAHLQPFLLQEELAARKTPPQKKRPLEELEKEAAYLAYLWEGLARGVARLQEELQPEKGEEPDTPWLSQETAYWPGEEEAPAAGKAALEDLWNSHAQRGTAFPPFLELLGPLLKLEETARRAFPLWEEVAEEENGLAIYGQGGPRPRSQKELSERAAAQEGTYLEKYKKAALRAAQAL